MTRNVPIVNGETHHLQSLLCNLWSICLGHADSSCHGRVLNDLHKQTPASKNSSSSTMVDSSPHQKFTQNKHVLSLKQMSEKRTNLMTSCSGQSATDIYVNFWPHYDDPPLLLRHQDNRPYAIAQTFVTCDVVSKIGSNLEACFFRNGLMYLS